jgi:hypothetical protein
MERTCSVFSGFAFFLETLGDTLGAFEYVLGDEVRRWP